MNKRKILLTLSICVLVPIFLALIFSQDGLLNLENHKDDDLMDWGEWPDSSNTGLTDPSLLTIETNPITVTEDNQIIENLDLRNMLTIRANNITVRNCRIWGSDSVACIYINAGTRITIEYCELGKDVPCRIKGISAVGRDIFGTGELLEFSVRYCYFHHLEDGIFIGHTETFSNATHKAIIEHNYITDIIALDDSHNDGFQSQGPISYLLLQHNNIQIPNQQTSAVSFFSSWGAISNVNVNNNLLNGGQYTIYSRINPFPTTNLSITNNYFGREYNSWLWSTDISCETYGNVWYDTEESVNGHPESGGLE